MVFFIALKMMTSDAAFNTACHYYTDSALLTTLSNTCVGKNIGIVYWTVWGSIHYLWGGGGGGYKDFDRRVSFFLCNNIILQRLIRCLRLSLNISGTCVRDFYFDSPPIMNTWIVHTTGCPFNIHIYWLPLKYVFILLFRSKRSLNLFLLLTMLPLTISILMNDR